MIAPLVLSFDLDDTLWPVEPVILAAEAAMWKWLREQHAEAMREHSIETVRAIRARVALKFPQRSHDMTFLRHRAIMELFGEHPDARNHADAAFEVFFRERNRVTLYADVQDALERLKRRYRLFALSNGNADLKRCGLAEFFEGHVTAISAGAPKPDARIFEQLVRHAGVRAEQVLHIGDDPHTDVYGAARAGLQAVWLNRDARHWPEGLTPPPRTISTLAEIV
jgi:FMN hydrolase / 5-amino-6-(5-phospho-D-ribitylamino)uracil phosphatase